jgi:hypothetical protein
LTVAAVLPAQDFRAKLTLTVADPAGSAIPAAGLELRSMATAQVLPAAEGTGIVLQSYQAGLTGIDRAPETKETKKK